MRDPRRRTLPELENVMDYLISASGLALVVAPWLFRYSSNTTATITSLVLGAIICVVAGYRALSKDTHKWEEWAVMIAGLLAIASPFVLGFASPAIWSFVILGVLAAGLGAYQAFSAGPSTPTSTPGRP